MRHFHKTNINKIPPLFYTSLGHNFSHTHRHARERMANPMRGRSWRWCRVCSRMGVAKQHRDHRVSTKIGRACALEGGGLENRPSTLSRDRSSACSSFKRTIPAILTFPAPIIGDILAAFLGEILAAIPRRDRRRVGGDGQSSRVVEHDRDISSERARRRYRDAAACLGWKFYQYRGGHLVSLWQSLAKSYAPNADRGLTPSRPINRRGLPE